MERNILKLMEVINGLLQIGSGRNGGLVVRVSSLKRDSM